MMKLLLLVGVLPALFVGHGLLVSAVTHQKFRLSNISRWLCSGDERTYSYTLLAVILGILFIVTLYFDGNIAPVLG